MRPNFNEEKKLWRRGFKFVAGLDEAGRGPLAGPVVAAAVVLLNPKSQIPMTNKIINPKFQKRFGHWTLGFGVFGIKDSKQLSPKKREELYKIITTHPNIEWGIGKVSEKIIDRINILEATKLAMKRAVRNLEKKIRKNSPMQKSRDREISALVGSAGFLVLDGNFTIDNLDIPQKSIIKADVKVFSCAAASIIAKVTRDRIMLKYDKKYPKYGFKKHKGYPTKSHRKILKKIGPCPIHRKSFSWI